MEQGLSDESSFAIVTLGSRMSKIVEEVVRVSGHHRVEIGENGFSGEIPMQLSYDVVALVDMLRFQEIYDRFVHRVRHGCEHDANAAHVGELDDLLQVSAEHAQVIEVIVGVLQGAPVVESVGEIEPVRVGYDPTL
jgi:hypothetical protein